MSQQLNIPRATLRYQTLRIDKSIQLGHGAYGAVYKATCDYLPCAAKVLHPTIVNPADQGADKIEQRFRLECRLLNDIRHPNIVQYLAVDIDKDTGLTVLLMELLDESLTSLLENSPGPLPFCTEVDIAVDVSLAISYLHLNDIIHRDLSSNNVLVLAGRRAKVTDFGMARLSDPSAQLSQLTTCPGTPVFMPPEALDEPPMYTEKLDCFSEGVLFIQICTRKWPEPTHRTRSVYFPQSPTGSAMMPILERERRKEDIDTISDDHPFLGIALQCLENEIDVRPTSEEIAQQLTVVKNSARYSNSIPERNQRPSLHSKRSSPPEHYKTDDEDEKEKAKIRFENLRREHDMVIKELEDKQKQVLKQDKEIQYLQEQTKTLKERVAANEKEFVVLGSDKSEELSFDWTEGKSAPEPITRGSSVTHGDSVYFQSGGKMYKYNSSTCEWNPIPTCPQANGGLVIIRNLVTVVGGESRTDREVTNKLLSLSSEDDQWLERFPPMTTKRKHSAITSCESYVIAAGGTTSQNVQDNMDVVEVLNTESETWQTVSSLPYPLSKASATCCGGCVYLMGGEIPSGKTKSVFACSVSDLVQGRRNSSSFSLTRIKNKFRRSTSECSWCKVADLPKYYSTCASYRGQLLAIGGWDSDCNRSNNIYSYNSRRDTWSVSGEMTVHRSFCFAAVLPNNIIVVAGGYDSSSKKTGKIEISGVFYNTL